MTRADRRLARHATRAAIRQEMDQHPVERGEHDREYQIDTRYWKASCRDCGVICCPAESCPRCGAMPLVSTPPPERVRVLPGEAVPAPRPNPHYSQTWPVEGESAAGEAGVESDDVRLRLPPRRLTAEEEQTLFNDGKPLYPAEVNPREPMSWLRRR